MRKIFFVDDGYKEVAQIMQKQKITDLGMN
jgi:hypothetical protein